MIERETAWKGGGPEQMSDEDGQLVRDILGKFDAWTMNRPYCDGGSGAERRAPRGNMGARLSRSNRRAKMATFRGASSAKLAPHGRKETGQGEGSQNAKCGKCSRILRFPWSPPPSVGGMRYRSFLLCGRRGRRRLLPLAAQPVDQ